MLWCIVMKRMMMARHMSQHQYAMHREMASFSSKHYDAAATLAARRLPVESAMPGTTLGVIAMDTFAAGGTLFGTSHRVLGYWLAT